MSATTERVSLTPDQFRLAQDAAMQAARLLPQVDDLEACGRDCQERRRRIELLQQRLQELVARFGPL